jgi:hypothetical protein
MMIKFNPENKEVLTYGEALHPAMKVQDKEEARQYLADYAAFIQKFLEKKPNPQGFTAMEIAMKNIGYFAGYYDAETNRRIQALFDVEHPIFGKTTPTPEEAFNAGVKLTTTGVE